MNGPESEVDLDALPEADWCTYFRIPDVVQELAYNIVVDRPIDVERYARAWLVDLKRAMVANGNATCAQGINLSSVNAVRGARESNLADASAKCVAVRNAETALRRAKHRKVKFGTPTIAHADLCRKIAS